MKRAFPLVIAGVVVSVLTSCASATADVPPTALSPAPSLNAPAATAAPGGGSAAEEGAASEQGPAGEQGSEADQAPIETDPLACLHGTWLADNDFFLARIQELGNEVQGVSGRVLLQFDADGTLSTEYQDWTITAVTDGAEVQLIRAGVDSGTYAVTDDTVQLNETVIGSTLTMRRGGLEMAVEPLPAVYDGAAYSCSEEAATIETVDGPLQLAKQ